MHRFSSMVLDWKCAIRRMVRAPLFTIAVLATLSLAIGTSSALFSLVDTVILQPLPFPESDGIVHVSQVQGSAGETTSAPTRLSDWNASSSTFEAVSGYTIENVTDLTGDFPEQVRRATVLPRFFDVWAISPAIGRSFTDAEHLLGGPAAVVISDRYWHDRFQGDPEVLGRLVRFENDERTYSVVGVMPASFRFPDRNVDWWTPEWLDAPWARDRGLAYYFGVGRLREGVTGDQARANLGLVQAQLADQYPETDREIEPVVGPLKDRLIGEASGTIWLLFSAVGILLIVASTNIAALFSSREVGRAQELAIRVSLGATRTAIVRELVSEIAVLALIASVLGLMVSTAAAALLPILVPELPRIDELNALTGRTFAYAIVATLLVTSICSSLPVARLVRRDPSISTTVNAREVSSRSGAQWLFVAIQVSLSVTLIVGAGLLVRGGMALSDVDPGFRSGNVLTFRISAAFGEAEYDQVIARINNTLDELARLPGVAAAASSALLPGIGDRFQREFELLDAARESLDPVIAESRDVSPGYFDVCRSRFSRGSCGAGRRAASKRKTKCK